MPETDTAVTYRPHGIIVAMVTPMNDDQSLDRDGLEAHVARMASSGLHGVMVTGGSGEYINLSAEERKEVVERSVAVAGDQAPIVVGALSPSTADIIDVGLHAREAGAAALLVLPPYYIRPSFDGVVEHYERIGRETGMPIILYNNPGRTGWDLGPDMLDELCEVPGVVGLKDCARDVAAISAKIDRVGDRIAVLSGDDDLGFPTLLSGGVGGIWVTPNIDPQLGLDLYDACLRGDVAAGRALHEQICPFMETWYLPNHPGPFKEAMAMAGFPAGPARTPLQRMTAEQRSRMQTAMKATGWVPGEVQGAGS